MNNQDYLEESYNDTMRYYLLSFCTTDSDILDDRANRRYWSCQAEDLDHAVEQLKDAEPLCNFHELLKVEN